MKPKFTCCAGAYPNFETVSGETREKLTFTELDNLQKVERMRDAFMEAIRRAGIEYPKACADFLVTALASARGSLLYAQTGDHAAGERAVEAHEKAVREVTNSLSTFRLETAVEMGLLAPEDYAKVCKQINDLHDTVHIVHATPKES